MSSRLARITVLSLAFLLLIFPLSGNSRAQAPTGGLSGVVTDPSPAVRDGDNLATISNHLHPLKSPERAFRYRRLLGIGP